MNLRRQSTRWTQSRLNGAVERPGAEVADEKSPPGSRRTGLLLLGSVGHPATWPPASAASSSSATMLVILIIGLTAGPAVSLYGSPTVSPVTAALWASEPLPP